MYAEGKEGGGRRAPPDGAGGTRGRRRNWLTGWPSSGSGAIGKAVHRCLTFDGNRHSFTATTTLKAL